VGARVCDELKHAGSADTASTVLAGEADRYVAIRTADLLGAMAWFRPPFPTVWSKSSVGADQMLILSDRIASLRP